MREAIGGISIFQIVIVLILIFTGVMCLTINHAKAFSVKDDLINVIEMEPHGSSTFIDDITPKLSDVLKDAGYRSTGKCPDSSWTGYDRAGNSLSSSSSDATFCIREVNVSADFDNVASTFCATHACTPTDGAYPNLVYYEVALFYQLDIPIFNNAFNFKLYGSTKILSA